MDHAPAGHDDVANSAAGALLLVAADVQETLDGLRFFGESHALREAMADDLDLRFNEEHVSIFDAAIEAEAGGTFLTEVRDAIGIEEY